jgi:rhomboid protease GluP
VADLPVEEVGRRPAARADSFVARPRKPHRTFVLYEPAGGPAIMRDMFERQKSGSVLCPSCGSLVGVNDATCFTCGRRRPGLFGFSALLKSTGEDMGFLGLVLFVCGALYIISLAASGDLGGGRGPLNILAPNVGVLKRFGAAGAIPVFEIGRWWTVLSYAWLHGGVIHIIFNMMAARDLIPAIAHLYGAARTIIIYVVSAACGALLSSAVGEYGTFLPSFLSGAHVTIGASGAIFGLLGALAYYGRRSGSRAIGEMSRRWILSGLVMGFVMMGIDNWCHLGGLAGGYLAGRWLDPLKPERGDHVIVAVLCLLASAAAIAASLLIEVPA